MKHCNYCNEPAMNGRQNDDGDLLCPSCFTGSQIRRINKNFVIRYTSKEKPNKTYLIGAGQYPKLVGEEIANKHFLKALSSGEYKTTFKLRRGLKIVFHSK